MLNVLSLFISTEVYWLSIHCLEWVHTFFFFFLLLELSAEAKSFLLVGSLRSTRGRGPEWCEKVGNAQLGQSNGQLLSQWWGLATGNPMRLRVLLTERNSVHPELSYLRVLNPWLKFLKNYQYMFLIALSSCGYTITWMWGCLAELPCDGAGWVEYWHTSNECIRGRIISCRKLNPGFPF